MNILTLSYIKNLKLLKTVLKGLFIGEKIKADARSPDRLWIFSNCFFLLPEGDLYPSFGGRRACRWIRYRIHGGLRRNEIPGASPHLQEYFSDVLPQQSDQYKLNTAEEEYHHHQR